MNFLAKLFSGQFADLFKTVAEEIHLSPEQKAEFEVKIQALQDAAEQGDRDLEAKLNDIAGENIRTDSSSSDWFVRRARPGFIWVVSLAIAFNLLVLTLVNAWLGKGLTPIAIPQDVMTIFKIAMVGYTGGRTLEKLFGKS